MLRLRLFLLWLTGLVNRLPWPPLAVIGVAAAIVFALIWPRPAVLAAIGAASCYLYLQNRGDR